MKTWKAGLLAFAAVGLWSVTELTAGERLRGSAETAAPAVTTRLLGSATSSVPARLADLDSSSHYTVDNVQWRRRPYYGTRYYNAYYPRYYSYRPYYSSSYYYPFYASYYTPYRYSYYPYRYSYYRPWYSGYYGVYRPYYGFYPGLTLGYSW